MMFLRLGMLDISFSPPLFYFRDDGWDLSGWTTVLASFAISFVELDGQGSKVDS
jgi:hypothetical protein